MASPRKWRSLAVMLCAVAAIYLAIWFRPGNVVKLPDGTTLRFIKTEFNKPVTFPVRTRSEELLTRFLPQKAQKCLGIYPPSEITTVEWGLSNHLMCVFLHHGALYPTSSAGVTVIAMTEYVGRIVDEKGTEHGEDQMQGYPQQTNLAYLACSIPIAPEYGNRIKLRIYHEDERTNRVRIGEFSISNPIANKLPK